MSSTQQALIAGGGIGGLAAALAVARAGWQVRLFERAEAFSEVGAGIQLGPNVTRILHGWGLEDELRAVAAFPDRLQVRCALSGAELGVLPLGERAAGSWTLSLCSHGIDCQTCDFSLMWWTVPRGVLFVPSSDHEYAGSGRLT